MRSTVSQFPFAHLLRVARPLVFIGLLLPGFGCSDPTQPAGPPVFSVSVTPELVNASIGDTIRFQAVAQDSLGQTVTTRFSWTSSNSAVTVDSTGVAIARAAGEHRVTATAGGVSASATVRVGTSNARTCAAAGGITHTAIRGKESWRRADSPHRVLVDLTIPDTLRIERGSLVCFGPAGRLSIPNEANGTLIAQGTANDSIVFTAIDRSQPWRGIEFVAAEPRTSRFSHVRIEDALSGVSLGSVDIEHSLIRRIKGLGAWFLVPSRIAFSVVDSTAGVYIERGTFEQTTVRNSTGNGLTIVNGPIRLLGGRIENSARVGIEIIGSGNTLEEVRPLRVIGNGSPIIMPIGQMLRIWPTAESQDSLRGNISDTLSIRGTLSAGEAVVRPELPWLLHGTSRLSEFPLFTGTARLRMLPGSTIRIAPPAGGYPITPVTFSGGARLIAEGTASAPIRISGYGPLVLEGSPNEASRLIHVELSGVRVETQPLHPVIIEHANIHPDPSAICSGFLRCGASIVVRAPGSRIADAFLLRGGSFSPAPRDTSPALIVAAPDVRVFRTVIRDAATLGIQINASNVELSECEVTGSGGHGIVVSGGSQVRIRDCNIEKNTGLGVYNAAGDLVDARGNWWGDPAGPAGINGDRVSDDVDASNHRSAPLAVGTPAATITITPSPIAVPTADTIRLSATTRDAAGLPLHADRIQWTVADTSIAQVLDSEGLIHGIREGTTVATATSGNNPALQARVTVQVTRGGPLFSFTSFHTGSEVNSIWGSGDAVFAVGGDGTIHHFDGRAWRRMETGTTERLSQVSGSSPRNVYAISTQSVFRFDGMRWAPIGNPTTDWLSSLFVIDSANVFVASGDGSFWRFDGSSWHRLPGSTQTLGALWGRSPTDLYAKVDGPRDIVRFDGTGWRSTGRRWDAWRLWGTSTHLYALVSGLERYDGQSWTAIDTRTTTLLDGLWGNGPASIVVVAGRGSAVRYYDGEAWRIIYYPHLSTIVNDVWTAPGRIFIADEDGRIHVGVRQ